MNHLTFELQEDNPNEPAVGLVVLQSDETMEHELRLWLPDSVRLFHTRIPNAPEVTAETLHQMKQELPKVTALLPHTTDFKVIVYGCTSGTTVIGEREVEAAVKSIFPNTAVTNPLSAVKANLAALNVKRLAVLTPYIPDVSKAVMAEIESAGIEIVRAASYHEIMDNRVARISGDSINSAIDELGTPKDIDAIFASCTNLKMHSLIDQASARVGVPVISSNSALAWHIQHLLSISN